MSLPCILPPALASLAVLAAALCLSSGTAHAARKKPGGKAKGGGPSGKKGGAKSGAKGPPPGKKGAGSRARVPQGRKPRLPEGWPAWSFQPMPGIVEEERRAATKLAERGRFLEAAFAWDGVRALARFIYGPGDPRALAALARSAGSVWESPEKAVEAAAARPVGAQSSLKTAREKLAFSLSAGAASGLMKIAKDGGSDSHPDCMPEFFGEVRFAVGTIHAATASLFDGPVREGEGGVESGGAPAGRREDGSGGYGERRETGGSGKGFEEGLEKEGREAVPEDWRSLSSLLYPVPEPEPEAEAVPEPEPEAEAVPVPVPEPEPDAKSLLRETPDAFRLRLAEEEGPAGAGPGSREALALRSLLGAELCDSADPACWEEGLALLREASEGLDALRGPGCPDALDAKLAWARCLAALPGPGRIPWKITLSPPRKRLRAAEALLREAVSAADGLPDPPRLRFRTAARLKLAAVLVALEDRKGGVAEAEAAAAEGGETDERAAALRAFETAECFRKGGNPRGAREFHRDALAARRENLGWRHPETAQSLAFSGDLEAQLQGDRAGMAFWALALEALEGGGELFERERAVLELRLGRALLDNGFSEAARPILEKTLGRAVALAGETDWLSLESLLSLSYARLFSGLAGPAEESFAKVALVLDGGAARPRTRAEAGQRGEMLFLALTGLGSALNSRGDVA
ncbi:MAG: hypothetical protein LBQ12_02115, partial [Deltaproteobacteria bacterium]|nr:hypothetical protein [Deltaproteobacteria bacterium]